MLSMRKKKGQNSLLNIRVLYMIVRSPFLPALINLVSGCTEAMQKSGSTRFHITTRHSVQFDRNKIDSREQTITIHNHKNVCPCIAFHLFALLTHPRSSHSMGSDLI